MAVFFTSLLPQFGAESFLGLLALGTAFCAMTFVWLTAYAFAVARAAGWTAHVLEQQADNRLIRPSSEYVGDRRNEWVPIDDRD
jgi:citrate synthase